jgi:hypothetical protein
MIKVATWQHQGQVAQLVEHGPEKAGVGGSSPPLTTFLLQASLASVFPPLAGF